MPTPPIRPTIEAISIFLTYYSVKYYHVLKELVLLPKQEWYPIESPTYKKAVSRLYHGSYFIMALVSLLI